MVTSTKTSLDVNSKHQSSKFQQYMIFWTGQIISQLGSNITNFTIIWWITITYQSAFYLGLLSFSGFMVGIIAAAVFGVYVDRWDHKKILILTDTLSLVGTVIMIILFLQGSLGFEAVLIITTVQGLLAGIQGITTFALVPAMIEKENRSRVNSLNILAFGLSGTLGPIFGALLLAWYGLQNLDKILLIDGLTFTFAVLTLIIIKFPDKEVKESKEKEPFRKSFKAGLVTLKETKGSISHMIIPAGWNLFISPIFVLLPLIVIHSEYFNSDAILLSWMFVSNQVGVILASVIFSFIKISRNYIRNLFFAIMFSIGGFAAITYGIYVIDVVLLGLGMFLLGFSLPYFNAISQTIWQTIIPQEFQGRVISVRRLFTRVPQALSYLLMTYLSDKIGFFPVLLACFIAFCILFFGVWFFSDYRTLDKVYAEELYGTNG